MFTFTETPIPVSTSTGTFHFHPTEIIRCQASSNYTWFYLTGGRKVLVARTLGKYEGLLAQANFLRIHHGDMVNRVHIVQAEKTGEVWLSDGTRLTISRRRRQAVQNALPAALASVMPKPQPRN